MVRATAPKCILIVDKNQYIRRMIRNFLENEAGFNVCGEAVDGYDAIEKAKQLNPDLIVLDVSLPGMNGVRVASKLKEMHPRTPIVLFTFYHEAFHNLGTPAGFDAVVPKDGHISLLINSIQGLLHERTPQLV
jgi:DNA-binding NarL/FixJ family response regulator